MWRTPKMSVILVSSAQPTTITCHKSSCQLRAKPALRRHLPSLRRQPAGSRSSRTPYAIRAQASDEPALDSAKPQGLRVASAGEDAAFFDASKQSRGAWTFFTAELAIVLGILYVVRLCTASIRNLHVGLATSAHSVIPYAVQRLRTQSHDQVCIRCCL